MEVEISSWPWDDEVSTTGKKFGLEYIFWVNNTEMIIKAMQMDEVTQREDVRR